MSIFRSRVTRKGQATIPIEIREAIDLQEGDLLLWSLSNGTISATPAREVVRRTAGIFRDHGSERPTDEFYKLIELEDAIAEGVWIERWDRFTAREDE